MGQRTPCLKRLGKTLAGAVFVVAMLASNAGMPRAQDSETAEEVFRDHVSGAVIQSRCVNCHVEGGVSGHTRLVFVRSSDTADHETLNLQAFQDFLAAVEDEGGGEYVLNKIQGVSHGGGVQVAAGSADFANMERFLSLLGEEVAFAALTPETLFDTVMLASNRKTLRRAALIFAGRIPTGEEYAAVEDGDEWALRTTIRGLMERPQFHEFLIRGSNDRLLTDRRAGIIIDDFDLHFVDFTNEAYRRKEAAGGDDPDFQRWFDTVQFGARRAPLELIAYVVENDLPYTEILTADYIMANPMAAAAYGASTQFDNPEDPYEFRPSRIVSYYRKGGGFESEENRLIGARRVLNPGPLSTDYPHAGILNTTSFLNRYPTTATNRNRARARWTYYHFLGLDVEKSASRTTDPIALADTNNPTMHNPACTVCHSVLDPVAGAFQNYSDTGLYKHNWGGLDSLDEFYKEEGGLSVAIQAESWEERKTLVWPVSLAAGTQTLRVVFTNDFYDHDTGDDGMIYLDRLRVTDVAAGQVLVSHEFEDLGPPVHPSGNHGCAETRYNPATGRNDHLRMWNGYLGCAFFIDVEVSSIGVYDIEIVAWADRYEQYGDGEDDFAEISVAANAYEHGDTWYRDMRTPSFDGELAPDPDRSAQWLAQQIVADERFAEAAVKFWWPAIMGSEVAEPPEDAADADFEGQLLAANAQDAEVVRLANGFRDGFPGSSYTYNLKDLLVEIMLSEWFRADALTDTDPVRRVALHDAGARRLLTPEELAQKTAAISGVQWGRHTATHTSYQGRLSNALTQDYRLLYGGIDSDGITERARELTSVMAGVAQRHAVQVSCPVVLREFYLLPEAERRLFAGIDRWAAPGAELGEIFEVEADSQSERETLTLSGALTAGAKTVRLSFTNDYRGERGIRLDRLDVRDAAGQFIASRELEEFDPPGCNRPLGDHLLLECNGSVNVPIEVPAAGSYDIEIVAWANQAGDELPRLSVVVESHAEVSGNAADPIRNKLVELHDQLLGVRVAPDSPDVEAAYRLFMDVMERGREAGDDWFEWWQCDLGHDHFYLEGILDNAVVQRGDESGNRWYGFDWDRVEDFMASTDFSDPHHAAQAWVVVLTAMMMDYRYLYL